METEAIR